MNHRDVTFSGMAAFAAGTAQVAAAPGRGWQQFTAFYRFLA
jgi:hypothetical protein